MNFFSCGFGCLTRITKPRSMRIEGDRPRCTVGRPNRAPGPWSYSPLVDGDLTHLPRSRRTKQAADDRSPESSTLVPQQRFTPCRGRGYRVYQMEGIVTEWLHESPIPELRIEAADKNGPTVSPRRGSPSPSFSPCMGSPLICGSPDLPSHVSHVSRDLFLARPSVTPLVLRYERQHDA